MKNPAGASVTFLVSPAVAAISTGFICLAFGIAAEFNVFATWIVAGAVGCAISLGVQAFAYSKARGSLVKS